MIDEDAIRYRWDVVGSKLDERGRRMFAAGEVRTAGRGGLAVGNSETVTPTNAAAQSMRFGTGCTGIASPRPSHQHGRIVASGRSSSGGAC